MDVVNPRGRGPVVLVCEHASNAVPEPWGDLGLTPKVLGSHIAWDPGALAVAEALARALDAPLVAGRISRLVHDLNRPAASPEAMPELSEVHAVPGNRGLSDAEREERAAAVHRPFHDALAALLEARPGAALVTVHSFVPVWHGRRREVELGLLHDADARLADAVLPLAERTGLVTARNEPYGPEDGVTHTLRVHALPRGLPNLMIEIRSDLIAEPAAQARVAGALAELLRAGLDALAPGGAA